ncbi:MAG: hypothetical protein ACE5IZ_04185 [Dehalococcoidia bacterium]
MTFSLPLIALLGFVRFPDLKKQIQELVTRYNVASKGIKLPKRTLPNIVIPNLGAVPGNVVSCTLLNCQSFANNVLQGRQVTKISYVDEDLVTPMSGRRVKKPLPPLVLWPTAQVTLGSAYERMKDPIELRLGQDPRQWPPLLQYFRHCRNAAFHGNQFDVRAYKGRPAIDPSAPPVWRGSVMPDDATMNARHLIGDWLDVGDVPILLGDVDELLNQSGVSP